MFDKLIVPNDGQKITVSDGKLNIPDNPIIPFIEGDGIGPDITKAMLKVIDNAVQTAYKGKKKIVWLEIFAGEKANEVYGEYLPKDTLNAIKEFIVAIKGPLTTPVGGGFRSLNVSLRQLLDLYACVRPVRHFQGVPSPVCHPEKMNIIIFRENTEDVYSGIEWKEGSDDAKKVIEYLNSTFGLNIRKDSGIGIKPMSVTASKNLVRKAIQHAIAQKKQSVTLMHKGNIMKFTEGAFKDWGYELAKEEFGDMTITETELWDNFGGKQPEGKVVIKDRIADSMFQQILTRTDEYEVVATPNLNGDYISDACAAQVGGLGMAPGANIGDYIGLFEATHGTAPKYANKDVINPSSLILSGVMMLEYMGWQEAADLITSAVEKAVVDKKVTYDLARLMGDITSIKTSEFAQEICNRM